MYLTLFKLHFLLHCFTVAVQVDSNRAVIIAVPTAVAALVLIVIIIVIIVLIAAYFHKKKTTHKYVLNYHTVYGKKLMKKPDSQLNTLW